jgi:hypothetical protein
VRSGVARRHAKCGNESALFERSRFGSRRHPRTMASPELRMHALAVRLASKRLYIADLAGRLEAMECGKVPMSAVAYRLYARRMQAAVAVYPAALLATQLGRAHPSVLQAIEQQHFEAEGMLTGVGSGRALVATASLVQRLRRPQP